MATHDYNLANQDGASFRSDLNNALAAIVSNNSSSTAPATKFAHQIWVDTTANVIKQRNAANDAWVELWRIDGGFNAKTFSGDITLNAQSDLRFADSNSSNWVAFQSPAVVSSNVTWTLPASDGSADQVLTTNGSGVLSFADAAGGTQDNITEGNTSAEVVDTGSDGHFKVVTEGNEAIRVDSSRRLLIGTNAAYDSYLGAATNRFQITGSSYQLGAMSAFVFGSTGTGAHLNLGLSRNSTVNSHTVVQSGNTLGAITFNGSDGSAFKAAGLIQCNVDGTPGTNDMPGRLVFSTTADGASSPTERMRIQSDGSVVCTGNIFTGTSSGLLTDTVFSRATTNDDSTSRIQFRPRNAVGGSSVQAEITVSGLFKFNSGYGSAATAYGVRAWVVFNGTGTVSIRGSGNCSSITDLGTGLYRFNFSVNMPDANYFATGSATPNSQPDNTLWRLYGNSGSPSGVSDYDAPATSNFEFSTTRTDGTVFYDAQYINAVVVR